MDFAQVTLSSSPPFSVAGPSLPHFAVGGGFVTGFYVLNDSSLPASFTIRFYDDSGSPAVLPWNEFDTSATLSDTIAGNGANYYEAGTYQGALNSGSGVITAGSSITIQALLRRLGADGSYYEAAVPTTVGFNEFQIPFDATIFSPTGSQLYTGFSIANLDTSNSANVTCTARDSMGNLIANAVSVPVLNPLGHWANASFPGLTGLRGTIDCSSNTKIGSIAIRAIGTNAISSLPVITIR